MYFSEFQEVDVLWRVQYKGWHADLDGDQLVEVGPDVGDTGGGGAGGV